jgi:circadian clock protein KaiB
MSNDLKGTSKPKRVLRLYVAGTNRKSIMAIENVRKLLRENVTEEVELEVIDIYQRPICAKDGQIVAVPTLVKELPPPLQKFIGDLSNTKSVLAALELETNE